MNQTAIFLEAEGTSNKAGCLYLSECETVMKEVAIGIDLGGTNLKGVVMTRDGAGRHRTHAPSEADKGGKRILQNVIDLAGQLMDKAGKNARICGIGIGTPGFVGPDGTVLGGAENLPGWQGTQILAPLRKRFGVRAAAANDVTVAALAEARFGAGRSVRNIVCLALGTGIGGGVVIDGQLYKGTHGMAGEIGHIVVETDGVQCNCGMKGCVEQYASGTGIANLARRLCAGAIHETPLVKTVKKDPSAVNAKTVYQYVRKRDAVALEVHETACEMLARACGAVANVLSPDRIVLGGGVMKEGRLISDEVARRFPNHCWDAIARHTAIVPAELGENAGVLGAAALVFEEFAH
ncbi:MAG: ROK family protein [Chitinivibrionales bacterium]|nr:ROK family protein [Chitinivibrionales bacterium]MBD3394711.1 ROK family protein [Chitinivibrionales bacterium]